MLLILNDPHLIEKPPGRRKPSYLRDMALKLIECATFSNSNCVATVINGDLFHAKKSISTSHNTVRVLLHCLRLFNNPVYLVLGNHDIIGAQTKTKVHQPVGVILESGRIKHLNGPVIIEGIELRGIDYDEMFECGEKEVWIEGDNKRVIVAHASLNPESGLRSKIKGPFNLCFYGHIHWPEGQQGKWVNFGSLSRSSIDVYNQRWVAVGLLNRDLSVEEIFLQHQKPWTEIYDDIPESDAPEMNDDDVEAFIVSLQMEKPTTYLEYVHSLDPQVRERVRFYLGNL